MVGRETVLGYSRSRIKAAHASYREAVLGGTSCSPRRTLVAIVSPPREDLIWHYHDVSDSWTSHQTDPGTDPENGSAHGARKDLSNGTFR